MEIFKLRLKCVLLFIEQMLLSVNEQGTVCGYSEMWKQGRTEKPGVPAVGS